MYRMRRLLPPNPPEEEPPESMLLVGDVLPDDHAPLSLWERINALVRYLWLKLLEKIKGVIKWITQFFHN